MKKEKNNKYGLLKVLGITFLIFAGLTILIPAGSYSNGKFTLGEISPVGLYGIFLNPLYSFGIFVQYILVFLAIGGFYGVLNKTEVYSKLIDGITKKFEKNKTLFLALITVLFALFSSLVGSQMALFVFVPFAIALLMTLGYNKITSLAATVGSILIGIVGSTYGNGVIFKSFLGMNANHGIVYKVIFFVIVTALYTLFIVKKSKCVNKEEVSAKKGRKKKNEVIVSETKEEISIPLYEKSDTKRSIIPLVVMLVALALIILGGMFNWYYTFGIQWFDNIYNAIMNFEIGGTAIFAKIVGEIPQFGSFGNYDLAAILLIGSVLIAWIYGTKIEDFIDSFVNGAKEMLMPSIYVMFASIIFSVMINSSGNICFTIVNFLFEMTKGFNVIIMSLIGLVSSCFYNDFPYLLNGIYGVLSNYDAVVYPVMSMILSATYGLAMLILPVSITLIAGLKYMNVSYKDWVKYIWKFLLVIFGITILFAVIILLIIK